VPYSKAASKTKASFIRQYGAKRGAQYFYATANKRTGGFKGKSRGARAANVAFAKGSHWKGSGSKGGRRRSTGRRRIRG
jgi:hypothetical protein